MPMTIAELRLIGVRPPRKRFPIVIRVGRPVKVRRGGSSCAACDVAFRGIHNKVDNIVGEDIFQALTLATEWVRLKLLAFVKNGGVLLFRDGKTKFDFGPYFPRLDA